MNRTFAITSYNKKKISTTEYTEYSEGEIKHLHGAIYPKSVWLFPDPVGCYWKRIGSPPL